MFRYDHPQVRCTQSATRKDRRCPVKLSSYHSRPGIPPTISRTPTCFCFPADQATTGTSGVKWQRVHNHDVPDFAHFSCKSRQNGEPTSGLEPLTCSLRVIHQALLGIAQGCKSRISREVTLPWLAVRCTVLRSRWCQSGVKGTLVSTFD
jgi:hypothetical protein